MKAVLQRVKSASVTVDGQVVSAIGKGILVLAGIGKNDTLADVENMANKVLKFKMWDSEEGEKWKRNVRDINGEILCGTSHCSVPCSVFDLMAHDAIAVSQFTLLASTRKGTKPDFHKSAGPDAARELYSRFYRRIQELYDGALVKDGVFQAYMDVSLVNDGPVTFEFDSNTLATLN